MAFRYRSLRFLTAASLIAAVATFSGCASFNRIAPYPNPSEPKTVSVAAKPMSKMSELPIGAYYDEPRHIIVSGHQKGLFTGMLFGPVGLLVADQVNKSSASDRFGGAASKGGDLGSMLRTLLDAAIAENTATRWTEAVANGKLQLTPYAVFTVEKSGEARLYAMLRAEVPGAGGSPEWSGRYFARVKGLHRLDEAGWMAGDRFSAGMQDALRRVLTVCMLDTDGALNGNSTITAKGYFPFLNFGIELRAIAVQETADTLVVKLAVGDAMVLAGTHLLDRADYTIKPASFADPRK